jgi:hypothetical protein
MLGLEIIAEKVLRQYASSQLANQLELESE